MKLITNKFQKLLQNLTLMNVSKFSISVETVSPKVFLGTLTHNRKMDRDRSFHSKLPFFAKRGVWASISQHER